MTIEKYTPVSVKDRAKIFESSNEYGDVKDSKDAVPSTTNGLENKSVEIKANTDILLQHSSETEEEKFMSVKQRAQAWENNKTTTDKKDESNKNVVKNLSSSVSEISTDENVSDESGLESELETTLSTSLHFETNHDKANDVEENVDNQTLENALRSQKEENQSLKQQIQDLESEKETLNSELEKTKTKTDEVPLEKAQKELTELKSYITGHGARLDTLEKLNEENESLRQEIKNLKNENTTLNSELEENENKHSKTKVLLERTQKELEESKSCIAGHETKLKQFNKENESLRQEIKSLENENTPLKGTTKTKTDEVSLEKVGKRQMCFLKVASVNLVTMLAVGAIFSIAFQLPVLLTIATFVVSALIASGVTYAISTKPDTELKEVDIGSAQRGVCKT